MAAPPPAYQWGRSRDSSAGPSVSTAAVVAVAAQGPRWESLLAEPVPSLQGSGRGSQHCWRQFQPKQGYLLGARSAWTLALPWTGGLASGSRSPGAAGSSRLKPVHFLAERSECHSPSQPCRGADNSPVSLGPCWVFPGLGTPEAGCWLLAATLLLHPGQGCPPPERASVVSQGLSSWCWGRTWVGICVCACVCVCVCVCVCNPTLLATSGHSCRCGSGLVAAESSVWLAGKPQRNVPDCAGGRRAGGERGRSCAQTTFPLPPPVSGSRGPRSAMRIA